jgi:hypothetical protein
MAQPSMTVRIAANIAELRKNMAEGRDQIEATRAGFQKLATSFQGDKIIQAAHNAAAAVESIGGASKLTEREQERVNRTVEAALAKYAALGREAPQALKDLAEQTAKAEQKTSFLSTAAGKLVAAFSAAAIANVANKVLDLTGKLTDLSGKTGISTTGLQVLSYTLGQSGVSMEQAASAAVKMSRGLVDGDKGAADAVAKLGLNVDALIASGPEQAFLSIGSAIAGVPDPMQRAALAVDIFGKAGADLLPGFTTNMAALGTEAQRSGAIISADLVAAGDAAGDSMARLQAAGLAVIANVFLPMAPGIEAVANWLGQALTTALDLARGGVDALVIKGMEMEIWLREMALSIAETVKAVPGLGSVFGKTSEDIEGMRRSVQESKDALKMYTTEAVTPATAAVTAAAPVTRTYGEALTHVATSAQQATVAVGAMQGPSAAMLNLESRTLQETVKLNAELVRWANTNGAVLAPSIRQVNGALGEQAPLISSMKTQWTGFAGSVQQNTAAAGASTGGFMDRIKGLFGGGGGAGGGGGMMSSLLGNIGPQFAAAFLGPGSAADKMKSFATAAAGTLMGMIPGVGPFLQQFSGPIIEGLTQLAGKAKELLSGIFGGPSAAEREQRTLVKTFEEDLASALTEQQKLEAGGESWKATVIRIRDAYIAQGRSAAEAEADAKRLWESSKKGAGATAEVIADIKRKMDQAADAGVNFADRVGDAMDNIPRDIDVNLNFRRNGEERAYAETPGFATGSGGIRDFGKGTLAVLHGRERVQTEAQMKAEQRGGSGGGGVSVHVDARGALLNDYQSQQTLADIVGGAVMQRLGLRQSIGVAGAF